MADQFPAKLTQANTRLKSGRVGVRIEVIGNRLYLRATFPPRPGSDRPAHQQRLPLGFHANGNGLKLAEQEAKIIGALLDAGRFDWSPYLASTTAPAPQTVQQWVERFEQSYFSSRDRTLKTETTWKDDYLKALRKLPSDQALTSDLLQSAILGTAPNSKTRKRVCMVFGALCKLAEIDFDPAPLAGNYSPRRVTPRDLPDDRTIAEWFHRISNPSWRWVYGMMATYGLRNHEVFRLDFDRLRSGDRVLSVLTNTKTGDRRVWPCYPEWFDEFALSEVRLPGVKVDRSNSAVGHSVTSYLKGAKLPFQPYDLRHCWAVRTLEFGLPTGLAAQQMGHSEAIHTSTYHYWITDSTHQRAFDLLMLRQDRPRPPKPLA